MNAVKKITLGIIHGFWDSITGMTLILHIDAEIHKQNEENEAKRQRYLDNSTHRRTPSPIPDSAAAFVRTEKDKLAPVKKIHENADERRLDLMYKKKSEKLHGEKKIAKKLIKCCLLNGGFTWLSIELFERILLPGLKCILTFLYGAHSEELPVVWSWIHPILSILFGMMWVLPIFFLSKIVSSMWFADIANAAYRVRKGRPKMIPGISKLLADFLFSLLVQALFLVQSMLVNLMPIKYIGESLCFLHLCLLYSLYSFEYKWFNMGWELHRRLTYIELNWPYFLGFGIPLTVLTNLSSSLIVSSCIFSIFFPLFILSGNEAKPLVGTTETSLRLFSPVIFVSNLLFSRSEIRSKNLQRVIIDKETHNIQHQYQKKIKHARHQKQRDSHTEEGVDIEQEDDEHLQTPLYRYAQPPLRPVHYVTSSSSSSASPVRKGTPYFGSNNVRSLVPTPVKETVTNSNI